jgi:Flp pilus assembly pilin Flp
MLNFGGKLHRLVAFEQVAAVVEVAAVLVWVSVALIDVASEKARQYCLFW